MDSRSDGHARLMARARVRPLLADVVRNELRRAILSGEFPFGSKLPNEDMLCDRFGVSRVTIREAVRGLIEDGYVVRRQGSGTFVTRRPNLRNSLDSNFSYTAFLEGAGTRAGKQVLGLKTVAANAETAEALAVPAGTDVVEVRRIRTADRRPAIYSIDQLPSDLIDPVRDRDAFKGSLYRFLSDIGHAVDHGEAVLDADDRRPRPGAHPGRGRGHAPAAAGPGRLRRCAGDPSCMPTSGTCRPSSSCVSGAQSFAADVAFERSVDASGDTVLRAAVTNGSSDLRRRHHHGAVDHRRDRCAARHRGRCRRPVQRHRRRRSRRRLAHRLPRGRGQHHDDRHRHVSHRRRHVCPARRSRGGRYLQVSGADIVLIVAGQQITGNVSITRDATSTELEISDGSLTFGGGILTITGVSATLTAGENGLWGVFTGTPALTLPGVSIAATRSRSRSTRMLRPLATASPRAPSVSARRAWPSPSRRSRSPGRSGSSAPARRRQRCIVCRSPAAASRSGHT